MLTEEQIYECEDAAGKSYRRHKYSVRGQQITPADNPNWHIARAIEAEVRKQDEELIQKLVEALENHAGNYKLTQLECQPHNAAVAAGRARLEDKP